MDPFSVSSGCVGLIAGIVQLSAQIVTFVSSVRDAKRDLDAVFLELGSLSLCLSTLKTDSAKIKYPDGLRENLIVVLKNCDSVVDDMTALLKKLCSSNLRRRVQWTVDGQDNINRLRSSLESHKSGLEIALALTLLLLTSGVKDDTTAILAETANIKQDTSQIGLLTQQVSLLRRHLDDSGNDAQEQHLQKFLNQTSSYAETVMDLIEDDAFYDDSPEDSVAESAEHAASALVSEATREMSLDDTIEAGVLHHLSQGKAGGLRANSRTDSLSQVLEPTQDTSMSASAQVGQIQSKPLCALAFTTGEPLFHRYTLKENPRTQLTPKQQLALDKRLDKAVRDKSRVAGRTKFRSWSKIKDLREQGADPNYRDLYGPSILDTEDSISEKPDVILLLLRYGATFKVVSGFRWLYEAVLNVQIGVVKVLLTLFLSNGVSFSVRALSAILEIAIPSGSLEMVTMILDFGAPSNEDRIYQACVGGSIEIVRKLLEHGPIAGKATLRIAVEHGNAEIVKLLLDSGVSEWGGALYEAINRAHLGLVKLLLERGATIGRIDLGVDYVANSRVCHSAAQKEIRALLKRYREQHLRDAIFRELEDLESHTNLKKRSGPIPFSVDASPNINS